MYRFVKLFNMFKSEKDGVWYHFNQLGVAIKSIIEDS